MTTAINATAAINASPATSRTARVDDLAPPAASESPDLADEAYHALLEMIQLGRLTADRPLQERALAATLGISRTPLREAMSRLIGGGFAVRTARGQLMVREPTLRQYLEILQMRTLLEGEAAASAATRIDAQVARSVIAQLEAHRAAGDTGKDENHRIDNLVHDTIAQASGNQLMARTIHDLRIKARTFDQNGAPDRFGPGIEEHIVLLQALIARDPESARSAMRRHLESARAGLVARHTSL
ncbi:GntR family transcriptional regulator [Xylophilus sp. GOD-11R]|uniref:GntR family transcriptional regulator n=1 Tax=Xylophilus sp. GOD-11R TaxID=3089814 RepID=UPI00298CF280|nr:GntR family transcriptional regulator [Xylophilus sp. GOD-11R]WPB56648.1 GntR family transcriptional regulator [Xylophilus sp. GOD-11R]